MNSICIATYNGEAYIEEQLRSILMQISKDDEVIVSDDGSTDRTLSIIEAVNDLRIKIIYSNAHSCKENFAYALRHAKGDIIFLSDQDDIWLPGKYERCIKELQNADCVCTNSIMVDEQLQIIEPDFFSIYHSGKGIIKNILNNTYYGACMAFRAGLLHYALPLPPTIEIGHDIWIGLVAEIVGKPLFIDDPYILYRRHRGTLTTPAKLLYRSRRPLWKKIWSRVVVFYYVGRFYILYKLSGKTQCKKI